MIGSESKGLQQILADRAKLERRPSHPLPGRVGNSTLQRRDGTGLLIGKRMATMALGGMDGIQICEDA
jgi:hypothetical protein